MIAGEGVHFVVIVVFCSILTTLEPDSITFASEALEVWINSLWELLNQSPEITTHGWYIYHVKKKLPFTLKTAFWSMLLSLLSIPTRRPLRGSASRQLRRNATTWDEDLVNLVWGIERSLERYVNAVETVSTYGIWINLAKTMHFQVSSSNQLQRMTWLSGLKRKETGSIHKHMRSVLDPAL